MTSKPQGVLTIRTDLFDILAAEALADFRDGGQPFGVSVALKGIEVPEALVPLDSIERTVRAEHSQAILARGEAWTALLRRFGDGGVIVSITAATSALAESTAAAIRGRAPVIELVETVALDFWQVSNGAYTTERKIAAPEWASVRANYAPEVADKIDELIDVELDDDSGRIVLWHGPPGTGKTTAIRALARAWRDRGRRFQIVLDPDAVFARSSILMEVLLDTDSKPDQWRVLVIEDADELLRADAKARVGQALSRLLNVGDGILGQGVRTLILITTNEPVGRLHPAIVRPGRCLADIEFRRFTRSEASQLLGVDAGSDLSLAELVARRRGGPNNAVIDPEPVGMYL